MKYKSKTLSWLSIIALIISTVFTPTANVFAAGEAPQVYFYDDFESGTLNPVWTVTDTGVTPIGNYYVSQESGNTNKKMDIVGNGTESIIYAGTNTYGDAAVEAKVMDPNNTAGSYTGIIARAASNQTYYYLQLNSGNGKLTLSKKGGAALNSVDAPISNYSVKTWYKIKMVISGGNIKCYLNDNKVIDVTDPNPLPAGKVGLRNKWANGCVDDFRVTTVPQANPSTLQSGTTTINAVYMKWDTVVGATYYRLYRSLTSNSGFTCIYQGTDNGFNDTGLTGGTNYYYRMSFADSGLVESEFTPTVAVTTLAPVPAVPTGLTSSIYPTAAVLAWNSVPYATSYKIYKATNLAGPYNSVSQTSGTTFTDVNLFQGTNYYYKVSSNNSSGESTLSDAISVATTTTSATDKPSGNYTNDELAAHDYMLYYADCGDTTPNAPDNGDKLGLNQSVTDQAYGADPVTGFGWGYGSSTGINGATTDKYSSVRYYSGSTHNANTSVSYKFDLPVAGYYLVTVGTTNPWGTRNVNIYLEGTNYSGDYSIDQNAKKEVTYRVYVYDGQLNVDIKGPSSGSYSNYNDPMVGFISVQRPITMSFLQSQVANLSTEIGKKNSDNSNYYSNYSIKQATAAITEAQNLINSFNPTTGDETSDAMQLAIKDQLSKLKNATANLIQNVPNTVINPGQTLRDTDGAVLDAHGAGITYDENTKKYYWYGEYHGGTWPASGIKCYSSTDLLNWKDEGMALSTISSMDQFTSDPVISKLYGDRTDKDYIFEAIRSGRIFERPKVIYNDKTKKYVMWVHMEGYTNPDGTQNTSYGKAHAGCAVSDTPTGPFEYLHDDSMDQCPADQTDYHPSQKGMARDMNLFKDDDGSAYLIYSSEENLTMYISKLTDDYTDIVGWNKDNKGIDANGKHIRDTEYKAVYGQDYTRVFPGAQREAPAIFKYDGKYYLLTSGATGWAANENKYTVADNIMGPWSPMVDPFVRTLSTDPNPMKAFNTQTTCVIPVDAAKGKFIYVGDIWNGGYFNNDGAKYVMLPIEFGQGSDMTIRWYDNWDLSKLDSMAKVNITTNFPEAVSLGTLPNLPASMDVSYNGSIVTTTPVWTVNSHTPTVADFSVPGTVTVQATLPELANKVLNIKFYVIPDKTTFFVNCGGYMTSDYKNITSYLQNTLINKTVADQVYNSADLTPWGYVGENTKSSGTDTGDIFSTVRYLDGGNVSNSPAGTDLSYKFNLDNGSYDVYIGFNDPWTNTSRKADLYINETKMGAITFTPSSTMSCKAISVSNNSLDITVRNTAAQDPMISWIMIVNNDLTPSSDPSMGLVAQATYSSIGLTWSKVLGAKEYVISRANSSDGNYSEVYRGKNNVFSNEKLAVGVTYYYKVKAVTEAGETSDSTAINAKLLEKSAQEIADTITIIDSPVKDGKTLVLPSVPEGFAIGIKSSDNTAVIGTNGTVTSQSVATTVYLVLEVTRISDGSKAETTSISVLIPEKTIPVINKSEIKPTGLTVSGVTPTTIGLSWNKVNGATSYKVYKSNSKDGQYNEIGTVANATYTDIGLTPQLIYFYKVSSIVSEIESDLTDAVSAITSANTNTNTNNNSGSTNNNPSNNTTNNNAGSDNSKKDNVTPNTTDTKPAQTSTASETKQEGVPPTLGKAVVTKIEVKPIIDTATGVASSAVSEEDINKALSQKISATDSVKQIVLNISQVAGAKEYKQSIPASVMTEDTTKAVIVVSTPIGRIAAPTNMFSNVDVNAGKSVALSVEKVDVSTLNDKVKEQIGNRPVVSLNAFVADNKISWSNPNAPVTVAVPYKPTAAELKDPEHIVVCYIDGNGNVIAVPNSKYNKSTGEVIFTTTHFSNYAVMYVNKTFKDISQYGWAKKQIEVMASKGIINGVTENDFNPGANITRADFLKLLITSMGLSANVDNNFSDVSKNDYYYNAVGIAKKLGIVNGVGDNRFNPKEYISRQDLMVMVAKAMKIAKGTATATTSKLKKYQDFSSIAKYAVDSIATLVKNSIVVGNGKNIYPDKNTTRAEAAVIIYRAFNK